MTSKTPRRRLAALAGVGALLLAGCASDGVDGDEELQLIRVGALQTPAGDILEFIDENLAAEAGIDIEYVEFTDFNTPNTALADGSIEANLFQNETFLNTFNEASGTELVSLGEAYLPVAAFYSDSIGSLDELPDGARIAIPNDPTNEGRALGLLAAEGLIEIEDGANTLDGITANPSGYEFVEIENASLAQAIPDVDTAFVTISFALPAGLTTDTAILIEGEESSYYNILATTPELQDDPGVQALYELLLSPEVEQFEQETWGGLVVPAS